MMLDLMPPRTRRFAGLLASTLLIPLAVFEAAARLLGLMPDPTDLLEDDDA